MRFTQQVIFALGLAASFGRLAMADTFHFDTGLPNGQIATGTRPSGTGIQEIESADDFILNSTTTSINHATFYGLLPIGTALSNINQVRVEIYRVFPNDSANPPDGRVPTRVNSPSDVAFAERDSADSDLSFTAGIVNGNFSAANSVLNGIFPSPNQTTLGEGPVTGQEVLFDVALTSPFDLPADHYFFVPQVALNSGNFLWLSGQRPTVPPFNPDLQSWIRNENLAPDWLRIGTDIAGSGTFNAAFSIDGTAVPEPATLGLMGGTFLAAGILRRIGRRRKPSGENAQ
jgi:hypothetical protein